MSFASIIQTPTVINATNIINMDARGTANRRFAFDAGRAASPIMIFGRPLGS